MTRVSQSLSRRTLLTRSGGGFGLLALADLLHRDGLLGSQASAATTANALAVRDTHFPARAKAVIWLHLFGLDHERLTFRCNDRDFRLKDVEGTVVRPILS